MAWQSHGQARGTSRGAGAGSLLLVLLLLAAVPGVAAEAPDCTAAETLWSETDPPLDLSHLFCGERDPRDASLGGYHALAGARSPGEPAIRERYAGPNADGVSRAIVCLPETAGTARRSCKCSSLFPDDWSVGQVVEAVLTALRRGRTDARGFFRGPGGSGFAVEGWLVPAAQARALCGAERCIATAWPAYEDDRSGRALPWRCPLPR
ncbi:MAG: EndoU domain-containing protein [Tistlia sp.]|uniref:EndoU domain-containing protein n=1 Tax=Tistlia sp. TaxID=3057121 RepID=UPI0034A39DD6